MNLLTSKKNIMGRKFQKEINSNSEENEEIKKDYRNRMTEINQ